jgi:agmatinase
MPRIRGSDAPRLAIFGYDAHLAVNPFNIDDAISTIERGARALLERTRFVLTLGGDHTVALPMLRAVSAVHGPVAVIHFDAHLDTWDTYFGAA